AWIEANPSKELETSTDKRTLKLGDETIALTLADGPRGQFLDGSWNARSALQANADKVQELAAKLPYMNFLK
ncbi:MAG: isopropylmalate isomerase, partial [Candidatus Saccharibacteria bacterium]|nr:isopropylmalate isomerase [Candidatus Saccharibacteria bacterium]